MAEVGGVAAGTLVGRVEELGRGRMCRCWGQVGSYRISHVADSGGESVLAGRWSRMSQGAWRGAGSEHQEQHRAGRGWPVPCNNYTVPLYQLIGFRPLSVEDGENARLPMQEGKKENEK